MVDIGCVHTHTHTHRPIFVPSNEPHSAKSQTRNLAIKKKKKKKGVSWTLVFVSLWLGGAENYSSLTSLVCWCMFILYVGASPTWYRGIPSMECCYLISLLPMVIPTHTHTPHSLTHTHSLTGKFVKQAQMMRAKAQLEQLQTQITSVARKTGISSATKLALIAPTNDQSETNVPDIEWWDSAILANKR